jgi:hypothetical protein
MMKKGFSIFLSLLILTAFLHLSVATHYCGGKEVASVVSLTGKLASCDLECSEMESTHTGISISKHCCNDIVTFFGINNNYEPSFSFVKESFQNSFPILTFTGVLSVNTFSDLISLYTNVIPPGALIYANVDLSDICVFRI